ncbi:MAG: DUF3667 domain-containing protein [Chitinophagaceae bacterium]|nr:DUF3667 domain-containing protein [Chitinophagaceae bacterium]
MDTSQAETPERICPACSKPGSGEFCTHCSEVMSPQRLSISHIIKSIPDVFFDLDQGLFYTIKTMFTRPGETIRRYFDGERQKHYKPLKFVLFIGGLYAFLFISFDIHGSSSGVYENLLKDTAEGQLRGKLLDQFTAKWTSVIMLIQFPLIALFTWMAFRKKRYYYGEHFAANAFIIGEVSLYQVLLFPVYYLLNGTAWVDTIGGLYSLWILFYYTYAFYDWIYHRKTVAGFLISFFLVLGLFLLVSLVTFFISPILFYGKMAIWGE